MSSMARITSALGIDIGGTNIRLAHVDSNLQVLRSLKVKVEEAEDGLVNFLFSAVEEFVSEAEIPIGAIGIGIPGIVGSQGEILSCPNLDQSITGVNLQEILAGRVGIPVFMQKDVNFILYGESCIRDTKPHEVVMGFYIGTGLGFAMMVGGRLITGERGFAGEIGHIPLKGKSGQCNCGNTGCLELYAAGRAIEEITARAGSNVSDFFVNPTHAGDVEEWLENLTLGMVTAITIMDPTLVIVGGGVANMQGFPYEKLEKQVRARLRHPLVAETLQIQRSTAGPLGGCIGAARYCFDVLSSDKE